MAFSSANGGLFPYGASCALAVAPGSGSVASCSVTFLPPLGGGVPQVAATYAGDAHHAGSSGSTKFLIPSSSTGITWHVSPGEKYPGELDISLQSPASGTALEAYVVDPNNPKAPPHATPPAPPPLPDNLPSTAAIEAEDERTLKADREDMEQEITYLQGIAEEYSRFYEPNPIELLITEEAIERVAEQSYEALHPLQFPFGSEDEALATQVYKEIEDKRMAVEHVHEAIYLYNRQRHAEGASVAVAAARHRTVRRARRAVIVGAARRASLPVGAVNVRLKLNMRELEKLARGRPSVKLYVRVYLTLPSGVFHRGMPVVIPETITLKRAAKRHH